MLLKNKLLPAGAPDIGDFRIAQTGPFQKDENGTSGTYTISLAAGEGYGDRYVALHISGGNPTGVTVDGDSLTRLYVTSDNTCSGWGGYVSGTNTSATLVMSGSLNGIGWMAHTLLGSFNVTAVQSFSLSSSSDKVTANFDAKAGDIGIASGRQNSDNSFDGFKGDWRSDIPASYSGKIETSGWDQRHTGAIFQVPADDTSYSCRMDFGGSGVRMGIVLLRG